MYSHIILSDISGNRSLSKICPQNTSLYLGYSKNNSRYYALTFTCKVIIKRCFFIHRNSWLPKLNFSNNYSKMGTMHKLLVVSPLYLTITSHQQCYIIYIPVSIPNVFFCFSVLLYFLHCRSLHNHLSLNTRYHHQLKVYYIKYNIWKCRGKQLQSNNNNKRKI